MVSCTLLFYYLLFKGFKSISRRTDVVLTFFQYIFVSFNKVHPCGRIVCSDSWIISRCDLRPHPSHLCQCTVWLFFTQTWGWMLQLFFVSFTCWWTDRPCSSSKTTQPLSLHVQCSASVYLSAVKDEERGTPVMNDLEEFNKCYLSQTNQGIFHPGRKLNKLG